MDNSLHSQPSTCCRTKEWKLHSSILWPESKNKLLIIPYKLCFILSERIWNASAQELQEHSESGGPGMFEGEVFRI